MEMIASKTFCPTEAARKAGYAHPGQAAQKLMKHPRIKAFLGKVMREREERTALTADEMLQWMHDVMNVNPLKYFRCTEHGWWLTDEELDAIPEWVGRLISKMRRIYIPVKGGEPIQGYSVTLVDKAAIAPLVAKHHGLMPSDKMDVNHTLVQIPWSELACISDKQTLEVKAERVEQKEGSRCEC